MSEKPTSRTLTDRQIEKVLAYHNAGVNDYDLAKMVGAPRTTIRDLINRFLPAKADAKALEIWKAKKADILSIFQRKMLYSITDEQIEAMSVPQKMMAFGILFDKERLIRGQPTSISAVASVISRLRETQKEVGERLEWLKQAQRPSDTDE